MFPGWPEHCNDEGTLSEYSRNIVCWLGCTDIGIPIVGEFEEKEELKNFLMVDCKIVTCLKNKKLLVLIVNKKFNVFVLEMEEYTML